MYTQGGVTYTLYERLVPFFLCLPVLNAHEPCGSWLNGTAPVRNLIFGLIVHAYSCYQSENIYFICLLKRVIDPSVLNHSV